MDDLTLRIWQKITYCHFVTPDESGHQVLRLTLKPGQQITDHEKKLLETFFSGKLPGVTLSSALIQNTLVFNLHNFQPTDLCELKKEIAEAVKK